MEHKNRAHHGFSHSHFEHHADGSITVHHAHHDGPHKDVKHAAADLDEAHDSMQDNLGTPNSGEGHDMNNVAMAPGAAAPGTAAAPTGA
jgi:hypothetical protein